MNSVLTKEEKRHRAIAAGEDETHMTELVIMPDGRVFTFGTSLPVLEILKSLEPENAHVNNLLARVNRAGKGASER